MSWSGAQRTPAASETEDSAAEASEEEEEELPPPRRGTRGTGGGGNSARRTPADAVRAVARAVGVLPAGNAGDGEARGRAAPPVERGTDDRTPPEREGDDLEREAPRGEDGSTREQEIEQKREAPEEEDARDEPMGGEQIEKRQRIKTAIRSWTGSEELEPEERIEQAIKLWKGEEEQSQAGASSSLSPSRSRRINARTRGLLPITAARRPSSSDTDGLESTRQPRLSGILGLRETTRSPSPNLTKGEKWEQLWFVLYDSELLCFHSQKDQKRHAFPIHTWFLSCAQVSVPMVTSTEERSWGQSHVLRLRIVMGKVLSEYFLSAKSKRGLDRWILELNEAIESTGPGTPTSPSSSRLPERSQQLEEPAADDLG